MAYDGRGGGIRTPDPLLPKQMRYQTALRPDTAIISTRRQPPGAGTRAAAATQPCPCNDEGIVKRPDRKSRSFCQDSNLSASPAGSTVLVGIAVAPWEDPAHLCQDRGRGPASPPALPLRFWLAGCYNHQGYGGYSSVAERRSVAADVVGSTPTGRPNCPHLLPAQIIPRRIANSSRALRSSRAQR